jgi:hypothetical protein
MTHVATMPARQDSDPVAQFILVESDDLAFHAPSSHPLPGRMRLSRGLLGQPSALSGPYRVANVLSHRE